MTGLFLNADSLIKCQYKDVPYKFVLVFLFMSFNQKRRNKSILNIKKNTALSFECTELDVRGVGRKQTACPLFGKSFWEKRTFLLVYTKVRCPSK